jgi:predicted helicase
MDGMRKCLAEEFSKIYVFNLRGNCRTSGELRKKEAGNIFGLGSRTPIAITILVKNSNHQGPIEIYHHDIGDYLSREQKLAIIAEKHNIYNPYLIWEKIKPNEAGDWLNQRCGVFENFIILGNKDDKKNINTFFKPYYSNGLKTQRDVWCYNSSVKSLSSNMLTSIDFYNQQRNIFYNGKLSIESLFALENSKISWSTYLIKNLESNKVIKFNKNTIVKSLYRPFYKQNLYFEKLLNDRTGQIPKIFPTQSHKNLLICVPAPSGTKEFMPLICDTIPDLHSNGDSQCFPRFYYEKDTKKDATLFKSNNSVDGYVRHDAITDYILNESQTKYGPKVTKDDIFYYVYGLLHSEDYRTTFSADLKKMLPRLPLVDKKEDFWAFSKAGRDLAELHLNYEIIKPYSKVTITGEEKGDFTIDKIRFISKDDKSVIQYNHAIRISNIPLGAYDYVVNGRSAIEWILDRYQITIDKDSGIKNDPNDWAKEHDQPRYILDLILRLITVSLETMKIVRGLPRLKLT